MRNSIITNVLLCGLFAGGVYAQNAAPPLTLQEVVDTYVRSNLELQAARYTVERTKADQIAARLRPNPALSVTAENMPFSGITPFHRLYEIGATYSETIELGGKRALREKAADAAAGVSPGGSRWPLISPTTTRSSGSCRASSAAR